MNWNDVRDRTKNSPTPPRRVEKTDEEWKRLLTPEQYQVTRQHGRERPFSGEYFELYTPGVYTCFCCGAELFASTVKFDSRTGWPSFIEPVRANIIRYKQDNSFGMQRVEVLCNVCDAHLGHVFPHGPPPSGLRFCINSISLRKEDGAQASTLLEAATIGGGCFWCTEAFMDELEGVKEMASGYSGGETQNPTYMQVNYGNTGHAEVVQVKFNPQVISYANLLRVFMAAHNPTSLNRQGADVGTQYRSIILYHNEAQQITANEVIQEMQAYFDKPIVTEVVPFSAFYEAEESHQDYYRSNPDCHTVINPKLQKLRVQFRQFAKKRQEIQDQA